MDIFNVLAMIGGLALFLFGMKVMGDGLERKAGGELKGVLEKMTSNRIKGFLLGVGVTAVIQSSSATTVMVVGFVNSGIMKLGQAIGIIMGANVGTTVTSWILSLTGIDGGSVFMQMLKPTSFSPILAVIGIILYMFLKDKGKKDIGLILLGFAVLMFGMDAMSGAVAPLKESPEFASFLLIFNNPLFGVLAGAILTAVIQSSSASVGILQALSSTGSITFGMAIPIIMGQNIGTCVTALISSVGANRNARRASMVHLYFNIIGTVIFLVLFYVIHAIVDFAFVDGAVTPVGIAIVHTVFNIVATAVMLPLAKVLEKLAYMTIPVHEDEKEQEFPLLDERFLATPTFAVGQCRTVTNDMAAKSRDLLFKALDLRENYDPAIAQEIEKGENLIDQYEDRLGTYLMKLNNCSLSKKDSREVSRLLHCIGDFERLSDHAVNLVDAAAEIHEKKIQFSASAEEELNTLRNATREIVDIAVNAFINRDLTSIAKVEPLEQVIDLLKSQMKARHVERLQSGNCTIPTGFVFSDLITNQERVSDHCSNIAVCLIQADHDLFDTHEYLNEIKTSGNQEYLDLYEEYKEKYKI